MRSVGGCGGVGRSGSGAECREQSVGRHSGRFGHCCLHGDLHGNGDPVGHERFAADQQGRRQATANESTSLRAAPATNSANNRLSLGRTGRSGSEQSDKDIISGRRCAFLRHALDEGWL